MAKEAKAPKNDWQEYTAIKEGETYTIQLPWDGKGEHPKPLFITYGKKTAVPETDEVIRLRTTNCIK